MNKGKNSVKIKNNNKKLLTCIFVLFILILCCFIFREVQRFIFFHPWNNEVAYEQLKEIPDLEEVNIDNN